MSLRNSFWLIALFLTATTPLQAAEAALTRISGTVVTLEANAIERPLAGATVRVAGASATADPQGRFSIEVDAEPGARVHLIVTAPGHYDFETDVTVNAAATVVAVTMLKKSGFQEEMVVSGQAADVPGAPPTLVLAPLTVSRVAGAGDNVYRVLQTLPGVSAADDFGSRLAVRGGSPDQNLTVMDGIEIHNPYRLFGLTSAFNPDTIDRFELTAGGFSAKYGDRLSSILLVDNRVGSPTSRISGSAALSATDTNLVLEGGLPSGSWLVSGRRTYYDLIAERFTDNDLPSFNDLQAKVVLRPRPGHQLTLFGLTSRESTDATFDDSTNGDHIGLINHSRNDVAALTYLGTFGGRTTSTTTLAAYKYRDDLDVDGSVTNDSSRSNVPDGATSTAAIVFARNVGVRDYSVRQNFGMALTPNQTLEFGFEAHAISTDWAWRIRGSRNEAEANGSSVLGGTGLPDDLDSSAHSSRAALFAEHASQIGNRIQLVAGGRLEWNRLAGEYIVSPRGRATISLSPQTKLKLAGGLFTQSPGYEKLLQSDYFVDLSESRSLGLSSERSVHAIAGLEHSFGRGIVGRLEAYQKTFDRMLAGRLESPAETAARIGQYDFPASLAANVPTAPLVTTQPVNDASGRSYGIDVYLEKPQIGARDRVSGWVAYTLGKATIENYGVTYPFDYDRRHSLSLVSTWRFIPRIELGVTLRVASGFPASIPVGLRVDSTLKPGAAKGSPHSLVPRIDASGLPTWTPDFGGVDNLNRGHLPLYARLDLRFTYVPSPSARWQFYLEAINALNRDNASSLTPKLEYAPNSDRPTLTMQPEGGLPFFPSGGFRIRF